MNQQRRYLAYLLRLWRESSGEPSPGGLPGSEAPLWRASLQSPRSDELQGFASLADLFAFLEKETGTDSRGLERSDEEGRR